MCRLFFSPLLVACLLVCWASSVFAADSSLQDAAKKIYEGVRGPTEFSPAFIAGEEALRKGDTRVGLKALLQAGLGGDMQALAYVLAYAQAEEHGKFPSVPFSPAVKAFEDWLLTNLGQSQGNYLLAVMHVRLVLSGLGPSEDTSKILAGGYFIQSAQARNPDGMFGAMLTNRDRAKPAFNPPEEYPQPRKISPKVAPQWGPWERYWVTWAAELGQGVAARLLGSAYDKLYNTPDEDDESVRYYYDLAAKNGDSDGAIILSGAYRDGEVFYIKTNSGHRFKKDYAESFYYGVLSARYDAKGKYIIDDRERFEGGYNIERLGRYYIAQGKMTKMDYDEGIQKSLEVYNAYAARQAKEKAEIEALYAKAVTHLPELKAALAATPEKGILGIQVAAGK